MAEALRKSPFQCQCVLAGFDDKDGASLYWLDYLGTLQKVKTAAQGYSGR
jgi:20S proteasome subunit beta 4